MLLLESEEYKAYNINELMKYSRVLSSREREDIVDFILLRENFRKNNIKSTSIDNIENI
ncbi:hypothetical protein Q5M85_10260 [Paraclostridium bifermentans]|nr:hypothetical protein [Paraclostridium bifermentans]